MFVQRGAAGDFQRFTVKGRGTIVTGLIASGSITVGDAVVIEGAHGTTSTKCTGIETVRKQLAAAHAGANVGLLLERADKTNVGNGT